MFDFLTRWRRALKRRSITQDKSYEQLLREERRRKQRGDLEGAIMCLREAREKAQAPHVLTAIEQYLRLPLRFQEQGNMEAAVEEFRWLLEEGHPSQLSNPNIQWKERSIVYDKMRLAHEREGWPREAAVYGALSTLTDAYSRFLDDARDDYEKDMARIRSRKWAEAYADRLAEILGPSASQTFSRAAAADALEEGVSRFGEEEFPAALGTIELEFRRQFGLRSTRRPDCLRPPLGSSSLRLRGNLLGEGCRLFRRWRSTLDLSPPKPLFPNSDTDHGKYLRLTDVRF